MKTGIVILNYNDYETTKKMLNQIKHFKCLDKIVVVDNFSTDNSYKKLKEFSNDKISIIKTDENKGYAYGNNYGIKYLINNQKIDNIIISNPDVIVEEKVINKMIDDFKRNKNISLVAPVIEEKGIISRGWKCPKFINDLLSNINFVHRYAEKLLKYDEKLYNAEFTKVDVVKGCFFMIRTSVLKEIDYFDENTFLYYEENIMGKKLKDINKGTYIDNTISVIHDLSVSVDKNFNSIKKYKIIKDSQKYYEKEYNNLNIFGIIILRLFYYISLFISYVVVFVRGIWRKK